MQFIPFLTIFLISQIVKKRSVSYVSLIPKVFFWILLLWGDELRSKFRRIVNLPFLSKERMSNELTAVCRIVLLLQFFVTKLFVLTILNKLVFRKDLFLVLNFLSYLHQITRICNSPTWWYTYVCCSHRSLFRKIVCLGLHSFVDYIVKWSRKWCIEINLSNNKCETIRFPKERNSLPTTTIQLRVRACLVVLRSDTRVSCYTPS